ncbi:DNA-binding protein rif1 [Gonapodya sp. JEL0774]|nr:DNA-binding protein rif1 [Gonapodya sp. JEL0774]
MNDPASSMVTVIDSLATVKGVKDRTDLYSSFLTTYRDLPSSHPSFPLLWSQPRLAEAARCVERDVGGEGDESLQLAALRVVGLIVYRAEGLEERGDIVLVQLMEKLLAAVVGRAKSAAAGGKKSIVTACIWVLGVQRLSPRSITPLLKEIMDVLPGVLSGRSAELRSDSAKVEGLALVTKLLSQIPLVFASPAYIRQWFPFTLTLLTYPNRAISDKALVAVEAFLDDERCTVSKEVLTEWLKSHGDSFSKAVGEMKNTTPEQKLKVWGVAVAVLGSSLHRTPYLNNLLKVVEKSFNEKSPSHKIAAYRAWRYLLYCLAQDNYILRGKMINLALVPVLERVALPEDQDGVSKFAVDCWVRIVFVVGSGVGQFFEPVIASMVRLVTGRGGMVEATVLEVLENLLSLNTVKENIQPNPRMLLGDFQPSNVNPLDVKTFREVLPGTLTLLEWMAKRPGQDVESVEDDDKARSSKVEQVNETLTCTGSVKGSFAIQLASNGIKQTQIVRIWERILKSVAVLGLPEVSTPLQILQTAFDQLLTFLSSIHSHFGRSPSGLPRILTDALLKTVPDKVFWKKSRPAPPFGQEQALPWAEEAVGRTQWTRMSDVLALWLAMPHQDSDEEENCVLQVCMEIASRANAKTNAVTLLYSILIQVASQGGTRHLRIWSVIAQEYQKHIARTNEVSEDLDETKCEELVSTLAYPFYLPDDYNEDLACVWTALLNQFKSTVSIKTGSVSLDRLIERIVNLVVSSRSVSGLRWAVMGSSNLGKRAATTAVYGRNRRSITDSYARLLAFLLETGNELLRLRNVGEPVDWVEPFISVIPVVARSVPDALLRHSLDLTETFRLCVDSDIARLRTCWEECFKVLENVKVVDGQSFLNTICPLLELAIKDDRQRARSIAKQFFERTFANIKENLTDVPEWLGPSIQESQTPVTPVEIELPITGKFASTFLRTTHAHDRPANADWAPTPVGAFNSQDFVPIAPIADESGSNAHFADQHDPRDDRQTRPFVPLMFNSLDGNSQPTVEPPLVMTETKKRKAASFNSPTFLQSSKPSKSLRSNSSALPSSSPRLGASSPVRRPSEERRGTIQLDDPSSSPIASTSASQKVTAGPCSAHESDTVDPGIRPSRQQFISSLEDDVSVGEHLDILLRKRQLLESCPTSELFACQKKLTILQSAIAQRIEKILVLNE